LPVAIGALVLNVVFHVLLVRLGLWLAFWQQIKLVAKKAP
jgi:hypothetical protein